MEDGYNSFNSIKLLVCACIIMMLFTCIPANAMAPMLNDEEILQSAEFKKEADAAKAAAIEAEQKAKLWTEPNYDDCEFIPSQLEMSEIGDYDWEDSYAISKLYGSKSAGYGATGKVGTLVCNKWGMSVNLYYGDAQSITDAANSANILTSRFGSTNPGLGRCTILSDHKTQEFGKLRHASIGDMFAINTSYGQFLYQVCRIETGVQNESKTEIVTTSGIAMTAHAAASTSNEVILYTCYPFSGKTTGRYLVFATLVAGTKMS